MQDKKKLYISKIVKRLSHKQTSLKKPDNSHNILDNRYVKFGIQNSINMTEQYTATKLKKFRVIFYLSIQSCPSLFSDFQFYHLLLRIHENF